MLTAQLNALRAFYSGPMGLPIVDDTRQSFTVKAGLSDLTFSASGELTAPVYHFAFNIPPGSVMSAHNWLHSQRIDVIPYMKKSIVDFPNWNAKSVYFTDPAGNIAELIGREQTLSAAETAFTPQSILCISEVGIPLQQWPQSMETIKNTLDLPVYKAATDQFVPLGSPDGLLIAVPTDRLWFPTAIPCTPFPAKISLEDLRSTHLSIEHYEIFVEAA